MALKKATEKQEVKDVTPVAGELEAEEAAALQANEAADLEAKEAADLESKRLEAEVANRLLEDKRAAQEQATGERALKNDVQELVHVRSTCGAALRQPSTGKWIAAGGTEYLLDDGWLSNQISVRLLKKEVAPE